VVSAAMYGEENDAALSWAVLGPNVNTIPRMTPPELEGVPLPGNEHYRENPTDVFWDGLQEYVQAGGSPFYRRPSYYLRQRDMLWVALREDTIGYKDTGKPYDALCGFLRAVYIVPSDLYVRDPGSSAQAEVTARIAQTAIPQSHEAIDKIIGETYADFFEQTQSYIDAIRDGGRVSSSKVLTYFLRKNEGNIMRSTIDTALFFKMAARVDIAALHGAGESSVVVFNAARVGADMIARMFYDDFSSEIPLDWLVEHVPASSGLNDMITDKYKPWKDFDPVNRAGTFYHVWSIIMMAGAMDPSSVRRMVAAYYRTSENSATVDRKTAHGRIKVRADRKAAEHAWDIRRVFDSLL